jgi:hypothetical protein
LQFFSDHIRQLQFASDNICQLQVLLTSSKAQSGLSRNIIYRYFCRSAFQALEGSRGSRCRKRCAQQTTCIPDL